ncbi:acetyl-CoA C-acyltransferase [Aestuariicella hydrocarbonica]|uniref:Acetyl-CoA C-acyltransferase n=1 Tax=Pseudomaricurvus hydrocarbonicus TaxID=1470433 RepID=A0A9E5ML96_9GAMM|nr:acetyl-CoA C-acetyltransferase [Aestuariicella hydrocarbonica]NHO66637.1 acetyl-CoA C-acyltransferase [Aestuariicella hydrocarbonica]
MNDVWIIDACRTPRGIGKQGKGALAELHPQQLGATVLKALTERNTLDTAAIDDVIWGTNSQMGTQSGDLGRMSALAAGYSPKAGGITINRFCGSGLSAVNLAAASIMAGFEQLMVAGGTEMMSLFPGFSNDQSPLVDRGNLVLRNLHPQSHQGVSADAIATLEGIDREALDELAYQSQQRTAHAVANGYFTQSLIPVYDKQGKLLLDKDEYPRPQTSRESLAELNAAFTLLADHALDDQGTTYRSLILQKYPDLKIRHVHHAGNSSGVVDGAAAVLLSSPDYASAHGLKPRARIIAAANAGDNPTLMLNAPGLAIRKVLQQAGLSVADIDLFEINEAFAVVVEKCIRDLKLDRDKVNVNGGAIALGHPIGATGAVLVGTLVDELERRGLQRGLVTMCTAGGMAPALIIERV